MTNEPESKETDLNNATEAVIHEEKECNSNEEIQEKYVRCLAEMENMRKRLIREQKEFAKIALDNFVKEIIAPIEYFESAISNSQGVSEEVQNWLVGFKMISQQFKDTLAGQDIHIYSAEGGIFDPTMHEAIETTQDDSVPNGTIIRQLSNGYKRGDKVLRAAKVVVAVTSKIESEKKEEPNAELSKTSD